MADEPYQVLCRKKLSQANGAMPCYEQPEASGAVQTLDIRKVEMRQSNFCLIRQPLYGAHPLRGHAQTNGETNGLKQFSL